MTLIGSGSHTYEWIDGWAKVPEGVALGYTHGVVIDSQGQVIVHNQSKDAVAFFTKDGQFLWSWGEEFAAGAHGLYLSVEHGVEYLYLSDNARHSVYKMTLGGDLVWERAAPDLPDIYSSPDQFTPTDVAVSPDGRVYVADGYGKPYVHIYTTGGDYVKTFGGPGDGPGQFNCPHGVWVDTRSDVPVLLVADRGNHRIQIMDLDGNHLSLVTTDQNMPCCFFQHGDEIVIPDLFGRVTILDRDNKLIEHLGANDGVWNWPGYPNIPHEKREVGKFISPHAVTVDANGDIYVVEWVSDGRVTKLARQ
ncbi:MAG TPA: 6-bladed beta-propeller [Capsulimonadaceae bacterium]|jgi:DNA-binding beta-propeller fold protein YncE